MDRDEVINKVTDIVCEMLGKEIFQKLNLNLLLLMILEQTLWIQLNW